MVLTFDGVGVPTLLTADAAAITDPDVYVDLIDFSGATWKHKLKISNNEGASLFYKVAPTGSNPPRYSVSTTQLGSVPNGQTLEFSNYDGITVTNANKPAPGDIPSGNILSETVHLRLSAYTDAGYTILWGYIDFDVVFRWIDSSSVGWSVVDTDDFDDGTVQGWAAGYDSAFNGASVNILISPNQYKSAPYSLLLNVVRSSITPNGVTNPYVRKSFTTGAVSRAFLIAYIRPTSESGIHENINVVLIRFGSDGKYKYTTNINVWHKVVIPLPLNAATDVQLISEATYTFSGPSSVLALRYFDNIKVIQS